MKTIDPETGESRFTKLRQRFDENRMPRELTFSCFQRYRFLERERTRQWFVEALEDQRRKWPIDLWAWVIMPEHIHLIVAPREKGVKVGNFAGAVKEQVARKAIKWLEANAPEWIPKITIREGNRTRRRFWQAGGGYDRNIESETALRAMIDYIHANPVRRMLDERPEDWEWSSARWYAGLLPVPIEMDATLPSLIE